MRTNELRKHIQSILTDYAANNNDVKGVYFEIADNKALYPHIVFHLDRVDRSDLSRQDYRLSIDLFDRGYSAYNLEEMADDIEDLFDCKNNPQDSILPTFFLEDSQMVIDEDKLIRHKVVRILCQNYER